MEVSGWLPASPARLNCPPLSSGAPAPLHATVVTAETRRKCALYEPSIRSVPGEAATEVSGWLPAAQRAARLPPLGSSAHTAASAPTLYTMPPAPAHPAYAKLATPLRKTSHSTA